MEIERRFHVGAEVLPKGGVHFRVWAPRCRTVEVVLDRGSTRLHVEAGGYFSGLVPTAGPGTRYNFRLDGAKELTPDPVSRFQPEGPHGPSEVIDAQRYPWSDADWRGVSLEGQVLYELHVGTFTREGTFAAAAAQLSELADLGITLIELMPVAEFPGRFGWGYDGVDLFAPHHAYGRPDDLRALVDRAHEIGMGVILDVVYNHLGPDGNYLERFSQHYFSKQNETDWGEAINYDGESSGPVRDFFAANAAYWISEFHFDGLRLDATQDMHDASDEHVLALISRRARQAAPNRSVLLIAENEPQDVSLLQPIDEGGKGLDAVWNDDFHHTAHVALTGHREAYYTDYRGSPQELISTAKRGYLYQGQSYLWQGKKRGTPTYGIDPRRFVTYIDNHDQIANLARGLRIHQITSPGRYRAMTALLLLGPGTPLLFQGQEFAASSRFLFFADHEPELAEAVRKGRIEFLSQFPSVHAPEAFEMVPDPSDPKTFELVKLDLTERKTNAAAYALHRDLLRLRRTDATFSSQRPGVVDGAVLAEHAFVLRFFGRDGSGAEDRLLLINLGIDLDLAPLPEPLIAAPRGKRWRVLWSSEHPKYAGGGTRGLETEAGLHLPGESALVLTATEEAG